MLLMSANRKEEEEAVVGAELSQGEVGWVRNKIKWGAGEMVQWIIVLVVLSEDCGSDLRTLIMYIFNCLRSWKH